MNKIYIKSLLGLAIAASLTACDENAWNEHLEGFDKNVEEAPTTQVESVEYTLTDANYQSIATNAENQALAGEEGAAALKAVGNNKRFSPDAPASKYVPAFLNTTGFPYFTLNDGSSVKLTYQTLEDAPEAYVKGQNFQEFKVTEDMYREDVWGSEDYVNAFAPSEPASEYIPTLLGDYVDTEAGEYCIVTYNQATQEPVFGGTAPVVPEEPSYVKASSITSGSKYLFTIGTQVGTAIAETSTYGRLALTDATFEGDKVSGAPANEANTILIEGSASTGYTLTDCYGRFLAMDDSHFTSFQLYTEVTEGCYWNAEFTADGVRFTNKLNTNCIIAQSGTFTNVAPAVAEGLTDYKLPVLYVFTEPANAPRKAGVYVPTVEKSAVYSYNGSNWVAATDFVALDPAVYTEQMGQKYANLSNADPYLPIYLKQAFPYAQDGAVKYVYWRHYANSATTTELSAYIYNGGEWAVNTFTVTETTQFVMNGGKWIYDPNVTITLPAGKSQPLSTQYFQACVDWVFENICKPLGDTSIKSGAFYVTSYGNNEYYSGTSAYQGNVDLRASAARAQYPAAYENMTDDEVVAIEKKRFMEEVMPGALSTLHPDAKPLEGLDVLYTINFSVYTGSTTEYTAVFKVVGPGKFEPVSCTWDE